LRISRGTGRPRGKGYKLEQKTSNIKEKASLINTKGEAKLQQQQQTLAPTDSKNQFEQKKTLQNYNSKQRKESKT
jgi:hypothetical protein